MVLDHGRRHDIPEVGATRHYSGRWDHVAPFVDVYLLHVVIDIHLFDFGHPGYVGNGRTPVVIPPPGPEVAHGVVIWGVVVMDDNGAVVVIGHHRRRHQAVTAPIRI
jgi:hypothetical protein